VFIRKLSQWHKIPYNTKHNIFSVVFFLVFFSRGGEKTYRWGFLLHWEVLIRWNRQVFSIMDLLSTSKILTQWLFDWLNTTFVIFSKFVVHARRYVVWGMLEQRTFYIASLRIVLIMACQEVLPQVWPLMNQIRLFSIYNWNLALHPSMCEDDHEWKDIIEIVCK
jgi:hypothetical protein